MTVGGQNHDVSHFCDANNGTFTASVLGAPQVSAEGTTKEQAIATVTAQLRDRLTTDEVVLVDVAPANALPFRKVSPEEAEEWRELAAEIYRERDAQKAAEFPEEQVQT